MKNLTTWRILLLLSLLSFLLNNAYLYFVLENNLSFLSSLVLLLFKSLPLLIFLPWLLKPNYKASLFFCLLLMFYFSFSALAMFEYGSKGNIAILNGIIISALFMSSVVLGKLHKE